MTITINPSSPMGLATMAARLREATEDVEIHVKHSVVSMTKAIKKDDLKTWSEILYFASEIQQTNEEMET